jgi:UDP-N-acetylmuramyl tripeptide synthase
MPEPSDYRLDDSRRLTGGNLYWDRPSAIIDVSITGDPEPIVSAWEAAVADWLACVGYEEERTTYRLFDGGASLLISAPIDVLYSMCELNEVAWATALAAVGGAEPPDPAEECPRLNRLFDEERNPRLLALQAEARRRRVPFLWDDDEVSLGYGAGTMVWTPDALPSIEDVDWGRAGSVPVAMVTGTNGKSTTVRMTAAILAAGGLNAGLTSTDFIRVGERTIDTGDYSGTGGARMLMRQPDLDAAVLEVARGGLLRRGLGLERADVAVVTNVAADHLGDYGIHTVEELIPAKFIVRRALHGDAPLVLNADDEGIVAYAATLDERIHWFSLESDNAVVGRALASGGSACFLRDGWLIYADGGEQREIAHVRDIPSTFDGAARYNVANALAAVSIACALDIPDTAIRRGLMAFRGDESDNPGRGNWFEHRGVRILVDFAHNEHGMMALADMVRRMPSERITLLTGQAGDRPDKDISDLVRAACSIEPDTLLITALPGYERGRELMDVPHLIRDEALAHGLGKDQIEILGSPEEAVKQALKQARAGDLLVLLVLTRRQQALDIIHRHIGNN